jgi:hypothetical protein
VTVLVVGAGVGSGVVLVSVLAVRVLLLVVVALCVIVVEETSVVVNSASTIQSVVTPTGSTSPPGSTGTTISRTAHADSDNAGKVKSTSTLYMEGLQPHRPSISLSAWASLGVTTAKASCSSRRCKPPGDSFPPVTAKIP